MKGAQAEQIGALTGQLDIAAHYVHDVAPGRQLVHKALGKCHDLLPPFGQFSQNMLGSYRKSEDIRSDRLSGSVLIYAVALRFPLFFSIFFENFPAGTLQAVKKRLK